MFVQAPLPTNFKGGEIVLYTMVHTISVEWMADLYIVGTSTIRKCTIVVYEILGNHDKLFDIYIHTL
jgi:hypothetical protein